MGILRSDRVSGLGGANAINGSVHFPNDGATGTGDYLRVDRADNSGFNLGTNDFTIEFWFNSENVGSTLHPLTFAAPSVSGSSDAGFYIRFNGGVMNAYCFEGNNTIGGCTTGSVNAYTWYHIAYVRSGSTFTVYLDGTAQGSTASSAEAVNYDAGWNFNIGSAYTNTYHYNGYLSNLRIVNGTALYTSNFTVPNRLEAVENTVLLCCQSPGNVLQEASGKTLHLVGTSNANKSANASHFAPDIGEDHGTTFEDNTKFDTLSYMVPPGGTTAESNRGRGILFGGETPSQINTIQYVQIQSTGNAINFGDLTQVSSAVGAVASSTRALSAGGWVAANTNVISYVTIATSSNATDFGDLAEAKHWIQGGGSQTRGIFAGGNANSPIGHTNTVEYVTIATAGNSSNFGDIARKPSTSSGSAMNSTTRAVFGGGTDPSANALNTLEYVTIATTGDATDFGDLTDNKIRYGGCSSSTRGIIAAGGAPSVTNSITYITIATTGNTTDFGDVTTARQNVAAVTNSIRGLVAGGATPSDVNMIDYITIATVGNAIEFGDEIITGDHTSGCSDSHGGIS